MTTLGWILVLGCGCFLGWLVSSVLNGKPDDGDDYYDAESELDYLPRGDRVIVRRLPRPEPIPGDMVLPNSQQKPLDEGVVVGIGTSKKLADLEIKQHICFVEFAGTEVEIDGQVYLSMRDSEIHGVRKAKA